MIIWMKFKLLKKKSNNWMKKFVSLEEIRSLKWIYQQNRMWKCSTLSVLHLNMLKTSPSCFCFNLDLIKKTLTIGMQTRSSCGNAIRSSELDNLTTTTSTTPISISSLPSCRIQTTALPNSEINRPLSLISTVGWRVSTNTKEQLKLKSKREINVSKNFIILKSNLLWSTQRIEHFIETH